MTWLTPEQIAPMPTEQLGLLILRRLTGLSENLRGLHNFTNEYVLGQMPRQPGMTSVYTSDDARARQAPVVAKLAEAWAWLEREGYLIPDPGQSPGSQWRVLTERGRAALEVPAVDTQRQQSATAALGTDLHPRIEAQVRGTWNAGDYETAIFKASREIEIAVGEALGPAKGRLVGVGVINAAFGTGKLLTDPAQDPGEQDGTRALYAGFLGVFKNPGSHRHFEPNDPIQAAGIIRTADLLMRMLDDRLAELSNAS